jgi:hypothetical protein
MLNVLLKSLQQFGPALIIALGALIATSGGFWQAVRQSNSSALLNAKNDEIIRLQSENVNIITGGESFAEMGLMAPSLGPSTPNIPAFIHHGNYPLYDVTANVVDLNVFLSIESVDGDIDNSKKLMGTNIRIGEMNPGLSVSGFQQLSHESNSDINFDIFFTGRNGTWNQSLRMKWNGNGWSRANRIERNGKELLVEVSPDFPRKSDGTVYWDYYLQVSETPK